MKNYTREDGRVDAKAYRRANRWPMLKARLMHPWPIYKKSPQGGIAAVVNHEDGTKSDLGNISFIYSKRWGVGSR